VSRGTCEKCGAPGEYRQDIGSFLCGSCAFDAAFERAESEPRRLFKKYGNSPAGEPAKPTGDAA
jgi:hypothetical protein